MIVSLKSRCEADKQLNWRDGSIFLRHGEHFANIYALLNHEILSVVSSQGHQSEMLKGDTTSHYNGVARTVRSGIALGDRMLPFAVTPKGIFIHIPKGVKVSRMTE